MSDRAPGTTPASSLFLCADPDGKHPLVVRAESAELAAEEASKRRSVGALERSEIIAVWRLGSFPEQFEFRYDGAPLTDWHTRTDAKLVMRPLGRPSVSR